MAVGTPLNEAPLQTTELLNVGEAAVSYKVDSNGIKRTNNSQGHGMPVRVNLALDYVVTARPGACLQSRWWQSGEDSFREH